MRSSSLSTPLGLGLLVFAGCRFGSVGPATRSMQAAATHADAVGLAGPLCALTRSLLDEPVSPDEPSRCVEQAQQAVVVDEALQHLSRHAGALGGLAGIQPVDPGATAGAVLGVGEAFAGSSLPGPVRKGLETSTKILANAITTGYKRRRIRDAVFHTDRAIQCVVWSTLTATAVWRNELDNLAEAGLKAEALDYALSRPPDLGRPAAAETSAAVAEADEVEAAVAAVQAELTAQGRRVSKAERRALEAQRLSLRAVQVIAADHERRLRALERSLWTVAVAHNYLACEADRIGTTADRALQAEIGRRAQCVDERDRSPEERSAACRAPLEHLQALRVEACTALYALDQAGHPAQDDDGRPVPAPPHCPAQETEP